MAKGKRAAALFEVIQAAKEREQLRVSGAGGFLTPSWWFKGKARNGAGEKPAEAKAPAPAPRPPRTTPPPSPARIPEPAPSMKMVQPDEEPVQDDSSDTAVGVTAQTESDATESEASTPEPVHATSDADSGTFAPEETAKAEHHDFVDNEEPALADRKPAAPAPILKPAATESRSLDASNKSKTKPHRPIDLGVDRNRQQINLRLTFTSAAISSFGLLVIVGLAFLIGKSVGKGPAVAGASSIEQIKNGKTFPNVLNVTTKSSEDMPVSVAPVPKPPQQQPPQTGAQSKQAVAQQKPTPQPQPPAQQPQTAKPQQPNGATNVGANGKRIVGMQYVLVQSYPDPEDANDAAAALRAAGIEATVEKVPWFASRWPCVVGTRAFDRTKNNPEFTAYLKSIEDVSNSFAGPSKFRKFEPRVIGWKEQ